VIGRDDLFSMFLGDAPLDLEASSQIIGKVPKTSVTEKKSQDGKRDAKYVKSLSARAASVDAGNASPQSKLAVGAVAKKSIVQQKDLGARGGSSRTPSPFSPRSSIKLAPDQATGRGKLYFALVSV
jgi:hypothetical protein